MGDIPLFHVAMLGIAGFALGVVRLLVGVSRSWRKAGALDILMLGSWAAGAACVGAPAYLWITAGGLSALLAGRFCLGNEAIRAYLSKMTVWSGNLIFQASALCILSLVLVYWVSEAGERKSLLDDDWIHEYVQSQPTLPSEETASLVAYSDRDRHIPLFTLKDPSEEELMKLGPAERRTLQNWFDPPLILKVEDSSGFVNCHGWVFSGGRYLVRGVDVPVILEDNGYEAVKDPKPNDLVIYVIGSNEVVHTGLVHSVTSSGLTLIESKWGKAGRYIHQPQNQPYSETFAYYRSSRKGHVLRGIDTAPVIPASKSESKARLQAQSGPSQ